MLPFWSIAAASMLAFVAVPAIAQDQRLSATQLFALAAQERAANQIENAAAIYRALAADPDLEIRTEARFRHGMMLARAGRRREAATLLRALLDEQPAAPRVRIELARLLVELGDEAGGRRELRQAQAAGLPPDIARVVDQFATALRSYRPYGVTIELALAPDSNINRATSSATLDTILAPLDLSRDARARSGVGGRIAGQAFARAPLGANLALLPRLSLNADLYGSSRFNDVSLGAQIGVERGQTLGGRLTMSVGHVQRWYGGDTYTRTETASADFLRPFGRTAQLIANATIARARYVRNDLQDGMLYDLNTGIERAISTRSGGSISLGVTRQTARDPGYANVAGGITTQLYRNAGRITIFGAATIRYLEGDARFFLFSARRQEWLGRLSLGATFRQATVRGFAPLTRVTVERNRSTIGLYDYRRVSWDIGISRAF